MHWTTVPFDSRTPLTLNINEDHKKLLCGLYLPIFTILEIRTEKYLVFVNLSNNTPIICQHKLSCYKSLYFPKQKML